MRVPVSYTHLDVYKRQGRRGAEVPVSGLPAGTKSGKREFANPMHAGKYGDRGKRSHTGNIMERQPF